MTVINEPLRMSTSPPSLFFLLCNKLGRVGGGKEDLSPINALRPGTGGKRWLTPRKGSFIILRGGQGGRGGGYKKGHTTAAAGAWYPFLKGEERRGEGGRAG